MNKRARASKYISNINDITQKLHNQVKVILYQLPHIHYTIIVTLLSAPTFIIMRQL